MSNANLPEDKTGMIENVDLELTFKSFMHKLQDDIQLYLGEGIPFMMKLDVKIGVEPKNETKMRVYEPRLTRLLNSMPATIKTVEDKKEVE